MGREFKFRVYDKVFHKFCYCSPLVFHSTSLSKMKRDEYKVYGQVLSPCNERDNDHYALSCDQFFSDDQDRFVIQQFTGIQDILGVDIYEGDIIETTLGLAGIKPGEKSPVIYQQIQCCFTVFGMTVSQYNINGLGYKIIGNIFNVKDSKLASSS